MGEKSLVLQGQTFDTSILAGLVSPSSLEVYSRDFMAYLAFAGSPENALQPATLARWRSHLVNVEKLAASTIIRKLSSVKSMLVAAEEGGYIEKGLADDFKRVKNVKAKALKERRRDNVRTRISPREMRRLTSTPDTSTLKGLRDAALLHTLASSGVRVSEAATLTVHQIGQEGGNYYLSIQGKNDEHPRRANLSPEAHALLMRWIAERGVQADDVFLGIKRKKGELQPRHMSNVSVWRTVQGYALACGLSHIKPHDFRRFVGTQLAHKDIRKAQLALGHKRIETTALYDLAEAELGLTNHLY